MCVEWVGGLQPWPFELIDGPCSGSSIIISDGP